MKRDSLILPSIGQASVAMLKTVTRSARRLTIRNVSRLNRELSRRLHVKQVDEFQDDGVRHLSRFFRTQIHSAALRLAELAGDDNDDESLSVADPEALARNIFTPSEWNKRLIDVTLPFIAQHMLRAAEVEHQRLQSELRALKDINDDEPLQTTASRWLEANGADGLEGITFSILSEAVQPSVVQLQVATQLPRNVIQQIQARLVESFSQPYWEKVNETTLRDVGEHIRRGLLEGKSIRQMAADMEGDLLETGDYARIRALRIARTESGNALNGARSSVMDTTIDDLSGQIPVRKTWLSVLGTTTRETHANLDGVPADKDGLWHLGGVRVRWPSDVNLPPGERIACQCTLTVDFGMTDADADELLADYELRRLAAEEADRETDAILP